MSPDAYAAKTVRREFERDENAAVNILVIGMKREGLEK
jgi:hypothetical protein